MSIPMSRFPATALLCPGLFAAALLGFGASAIAAEQGSAAPIRDPLEVQKGRDAKLLKRGSVTYYDERWNLDDLPEYKPQAQVSGVIRQWGSNYFQHGSLGKAWEEGFRKYHPGITFENDLKTTLNAIPGLTFGWSDLGPSRKITSDETLLYQRYHDSFPVEVSVVTGSMNVPGWSYALGIYVHKDNPLTKLTIEQLDGIFGAERSGAFKGTEWDTSVARGPGKNIRTWGQLGLKGEWKDKPITVLGYNIKYHIPLTFSNRVMEDSAKWNEKLVEFTNYRNADGTTELQGKQVKDALAKDKYAIGYSSEAFPKEELKLLAIAPRGSSKYVSLNIQTVRSREYPLYDEVFFYFRKLPGQQVDPKVKEFVRYVLSREGQDAVQKDAKYMPLPGSVVAEQLRKLD
jgi:phosphate transport system substrate-binding protein